MSLDRFFSGASSQGSANPSRKRPRHGDLEEENTTVPDDGPSKPKVLKMVTLQVHHLANPKSIIGLLQGEAEAERKRLASRFCRDHPELARYVLSRCGTAKAVVTDGWCERVNHAGNKQKGKDGYLQVSYWGANHFAVLHRVLLWAEGKDLRAGEEASHLCHHTNCKTVGHVTSEDATANNARKNCVVWMDCPCEVGKKLLICTHSPPCIKYVPGFTSQEHFLQRGVCHQRSVGGQVLPSPAWQSE